MDAMIDCPYCKKSESSCECRWFPQNCATSKDGRLPVLTERQASILLWIDTFIKTKGYPPSFRCIMKAFKITSPNGCYVQLRALASKGYIRRDAKTSRSILVLALPDARRKASRGPYAK